MRTFLRLEFLYQQLLYHVEDDSEFGTRAAIGTLFDLLTVIARGDVRTEVQKELDRQIKGLRGYGNSPGVDQKRLTRVTNNLESLQKQLIDAGPKFTESLKESEFLAAIKHRSSIPGGTCVFDLPDYVYWLRLPFNQRAANLNKWTEILRPLCDSVAEALWLIRESGDSRDCVAAGGSYQESLDRTTDHKLLRIILSSSLNVYPEISGGQHRVNIRFLTFKSADERPKQVSQDVRFQLSFC